MQMVGVWLCLGQSYKGNISFGAMFSLCTSLCRVHTDTTMKFSVKQAFCLIISVLFLGVAAELQAPEVHTKLGSLRGEYVSVKGKETGVHAYLGVPFAKPPIGPSLRLAPPQPVEGWKGVRDATKQPPICIQHKQLSLEVLAKFEGWLMDIPDISEDCLYLNIYTPANRAKDAKLPVRTFAADFK
uniref:Carboxylesterase type B domain-containing protein n=1 Tax=Amphiprion percula TaxID=161767 RepID=A0A3P8SGV3_AMPPE